MGHELIKTLLDILYPKTCVACGVFIRQEDVFCKSCAEHIKPVPKSFIHITPDCSLTVHAIGQYRGALKRLVLQKFFYDRFASYQLGLLMCDKIRKIPELSQNSVIIPVPLHWTRYARRGFNQSYEMAKVLEKKLDIPVIRLLKRNKRTKFQLKLSKSSRRENVKNAFCVHEKFRDNLRDTIHNKNIIIIDDLCTTGATLKNMSKLLKGPELAPRSISAIVACRAIFA